MDKTNKPRKGPLQRRLEAAREIADAVPREVASMPQRRPHKVRTKFRVAAKTMLPELVHGEVREIFHVKLVAVFEGRPVHSGLGYIQGNADNRIFGDGEPEADITWKIQSKAVADLFPAGAAFHVDLTEILPGV